MTESMIAAAVPWAERIMRKIDGVIAQEAVVHFHLFSFSRCFSNSKSPALARRDVEGRSPAKYVRRCQAAAPRTAGIGTGRIVGKVLL